MAEADADANVSAAMKAGQIARQSDPFARGYMACERCRQRKVKCIVQDTPPCAKCKREHRSCLFTQYRSNRKQRKPPDWATSTAQQQEDQRLSQEVPVDLGNADLRLQTASPPLGDLPMNNDVVYARTQRSLVERAVPIAIVDSGDSAIFSTGAFQPPESIISHATPPLGESVPRDWQPTSNPGQGSASAVPIVVNELYPASQELLSVWNKCRFVRQGLLTAQAAITFVEL